MGAFARPPSPGAESQELRSEVSCAHHGNRALPGLAWGRTRTCQTLGWKEGTQGIENTWNREGARSQAASPPF